MEWSNQESQNRQSNDIQIHTNNTDSNKRDKLQEIIGNNNIKTLDTNHKLYDYFEKEDVREKMIRMFISRPELLNQLRG